MFMYSFAAVVSSRRESVHTRQRTRAEAALLGRMPLLLKVEPGAAEQPFRRVLAQIAGEPTEA